MLWLLLAAFFNALMDRFENESFFDSRFASWNQKFWYKRESWKWAKKIFGYKIDAWHLSKSCMVICITAAFSRNLIEFIVLGLMWNGVFNFFYGILGRKKI